eukprot:12421732-Karenia_brevis.AAC.1
MGARAFLKRPRRCCSSSLSARHSSGARVPDSSPTFPPGGVGPVPQILVVRVWHVEKIAAQLDWGGRGGGSMLFGSLRGVVDRT